MENYKEELNKLLREAEMLNSPEGEKAEDNMSSSAYTQMIEELKNYSNIVASFRRKSWLGKETLRLKVG
jgi:hypothetical protein